MGAADPPLQSIHGRFDVGPALMRVPRNHGQSLVTRNALDCGQVDARLNQMCHRRMAKRVRRDLVRIKASALSGAAKGLSDRVDMAGGASRRGKQPFAAGRQHIHAFSKIIGQLARDRLLTRPRFGLRNPDHSLSDIDIFSTDRENFRMTHPCMQSDHDESVDVFVVIRCRRFQQRNALIIRQVHNSLIVFLEASDLDRLTLDPFPLNRLIQQMGQCGQFPIDGRLCCARRAAGLLVTFNVEGLDSTQRLGCEKWDQVLFQLTLFDVDVLSVTITKPLDIG